MRPELECIILYCFLISLWLCRTKAPWCWFDYFPISILMLHHQLSKVLLFSGMDVDMESPGSSQYPSPDQYVMSEEAEEGWVSWAWSFVPAIVGAEDEGEEGVYQQHDTGSIPSSHLQHTAKDPIVSIGFYCTKASVTFKVYNVSKKGPFWRHCQSILNATFELLGERIALHY